MVPLVGCSGDGGGASSAALMSIPRNAGKISLLV